MTIQELREKRNTAWNAAKAFLDSHRTEKGTLTAEDDATYTRMEQDIADLGKEIARLERQEALDAELSKPVGTPLTSKPTTGKQPEVKTGRASDEYRKGMLFDTTDLEREQEELQQETQVVSDMVQQCIYENAHVALDQTEYQKRYDGLTERFEKAKARLDAVTDEIHQMQTQRASIEDFLKAFAAMPDELTEFTLESWHGLVDFGTVYSADDIRFTFKNGQEIKA